MSEEFPRPRLGRGLAALLGDSAEEAKAMGEASPTPRRAPIEKLRANSRNPRRNFAEGELDELSASIREKGILQPIIVRPSYDGGYEIIAGERRWRAAQKAGLHEVPIVKVEASDKEALEIAIVENVQRTDLNALEEAEGYQRLTEEFSYSSAELAGVIGKSRSHIANTLRLLKLTEKSKNLLRDGRISAGHARALLTIDKPDEAVDQILSKGLSVRDVEKLSRPEGLKRTSSKNSKESKDDADTRALENSLSERLGMAVYLRSRGESGEMTIRYANLEQLEHLSRLLQT